tara:strand:+ start:201 stop:611 length:411 start_codon:yes stop_codon:yes gene_type:complete
MAFQATLTGNLGQTPELKTFQSGKCKTELAVAVRQQNKDAQAQWVQVDLWDKTAQYAADYLKKGDSIYAQGEIKEERFTRKNGDLGFKIVLQFARIELLKSASPKQPQNVTEARAAASTDDWQSSSKVPEVDEIPF